MDGRLLMERARGLLGARGCAAALSIVPLAAANLPAATLTLDGASAGPSYGGSYVPPEFEVTSSVIANGLKISGHLGTLVGDLDPQNPASYFPGETVVDVFGSIVGTINPGDTLNTSYSMTFTFTGGSVTLNSFSSSASADSEFVDGSASLASATSGAPVSGSYATTPFSIAHVGGSWSTNFSFEWTDYSSTDTLYLDIPSSSIDVTLVPEPTLFTVLPAGALLTLRRRRT
jgi:hypothetical protein